MIGYCIFRLLDCKYQTAFTVLQTANGCTPQSCREKLTAQGFDTFAHWTVIWDMPRKTNTTPDTQKSHRRTTRAGRSSWGWVPRREYAWKSLQRQMVQTDVTPYELAKRVGVHNNTVYEWLSGTKPPRRSNLIALARALKVSHSTLSADMPIEPMEASTVA